MLVQIALLCLWRLEVLVIELIGLRSPTHEDTRISLNIKIIKTEKGFGIADKWRNQSTQNDQWPGRWTQETEFSQFHMLLLMTNVFPQGIAPRTSHACNWTRLGLGQFGLLWIPSLKQKHDHESALSSSILQYPTFKSHSEYWLHAVNWFARFGC